jgi:hypothetical protein
MLRECVVCGEEFDADIDEDYCDDCTDAFEEENGGDYDEPTNDEEA